MDNSIILLLSYDQNGNLNSQITKDKKLFFATVPMLFEAIVRKEMAEHGKECAAKYAACIAHTVVGAVGSAIKGSAMTEKDFEKLFGGDLRE